MLETIPGRLRAVRALVKGGDTVKATVYPATAEDKLEIDIDVFIYSKVTRELAHNIRRALGLAKVIKSVRFDKGGKTWKGINVDGVPCSIYFVAACRIVNHEEVVMPATPRSEETVVREAMPERTVKKPVYDCSMFEGDTDEDEDDDEGDPRPEAAVPLEPEAISEAQEEEERIAEETEEAVARG